MQFCEIVGGNGPPDSIRAEIQIFTGFLPSDPWKGSYGYDADWSPSSLGVKSKVYEIPQTGCSLYDPDTGACSIRHPASLDFHGHLTRLGILCICCIYLQAFDIF